MKFSGLIAEYIRRHHYRESVQVLCHFMPIRDEDDKGNRTSDSEYVEDDVEEDVEQLDVELDESLIAALQLNEENDEVLGAASVEGAQNEAQNGAQQQANNLRLMHLRKGFRLSSMCWDE